MLISGNRPSSPPSFIGWGQTPIPGRFFQPSYAKMHMTSAFPILFGIINVPFDSFISQNEGNAEGSTLIVSAKRVCSNLARVRNSFDVRAGLVAYAKRTGPG